MVLVPFGHGPGIIPADAGSTEDGRGLCDVHQDHPRGCGEHYNPKTKQYFGYGSSPRMRGAHLKILAIPTI